MEPVSLSLAVLATADLCLKYGKLLIQRYEDYKNAENDIKETVLKIKGLWLKTEIQLASLKRIWESIDPRLQTLFFELLGHLQGKLEAASASLVRVSNHSLSINKFKAMFFKKTIIQATRDLESWQRTFDPSWYLITRVADPKIDSVLSGVGTAVDHHTLRLKQIREAISCDNKTEKRSIFLNKGSIQGERRLAWSGTSTAKLSDGYGNVLVDPTTYPSDTQHIVGMIHVRDLARQLSYSDPWQFGLLRCRGYMIGPGFPGKFNLVFDIPSTVSNPRTLRDLLLHRQPHALNQRFQLAKQLVRSIMFVHTSGFVHKGIRPDTIVVFQEGQNTLGPSFLVGFERFRPGDAGTFLNGDSSWEKNLYRHPKRQGLHPEDRYVMQHDIYSLGACLLEIGLWNSFVCPHSEGNSLIPGAELDIAEALQSKKATMIKQTLVSMAKEKLPGLMGQRYTDLALACLTYLDPGDTNLFGKEADLEDDDGVVVGVQYIEKIMLQIEEIFV
ncbi:hypothetical protein BJY04DRAFT_214110 [Aspergillus karnatakaensis]|uniref:uncharacterized protein n=1 Tax=Aspergillus karnatakaensis TaxID=1810916 RepID=UPI003CCCDFC4